MKGQNKGLKHKHEESDDPKKNENSKKMYFRRVKAYKIRWKQKKEKRDIPQRGITSPRHDVLIFHDHDGFLLDTTT